MDIKVLTVLFDYPDNIDPLFYSNLTKEDMNYVECLRFCSRNGEDHNRLKEYGDISLYSKFWYFKIVKVLEFLKTIDCEIVLFMDALDTNIIAPLKEIENIYNKDFKAEIVFGAEKDLWPVTKYADLYKQTNSDLYLNSGTYIGKREYIIKKLEEIVEEGIQNLSDDQGAWSWAYLTDDKIVIDDEMKLFFTTHKNKKETYAGIVKPNSCIIHDNGPVSTETEKLNPLYEGMAPMPERTRGTLIPNEYKGMRQRPEEWLAGSEGLYELIQDVNEILPERYSMIEVGSYFGESSIIFLKYAQLGKLFCVDPYIQNYDPLDSSSTRLPMTEVRKIFEKNITERFKNSKHIPKTSLALRKSDVDNLNIDFIYLDGDHRLEYVKNEVEYMIKTFNPKVIAGHDYNMVNEAINNSIGKPDKVYRDYSWIKAI